MPDLQEAPAQTDDSAFYYRLEDLEGPLDILLTLIRKNDVNIYDIPISIITEQFLEYISWREKIGLGALTEFYRLAAQLLLIKSRMLLPVDAEFDEEFEDPRTELVEKLIEYQKYRKLTSLMERKEEEAEWRIERKRIQKNLAFSDDVDLLDRIEIWDLLKSFSALTKPLTSERLIDLYEEVSINEKLTLMDEFLENRESFLFTDLITKPKSLLDIVCAFLAVLEAVKMKLISIYQHKLFGDIVVKRYQTPVRVESEEPDGSRQ